MKARKPTMNRIYVFASAVAMSASIAFAQQSIPPATFGSPEEAAKAVLEAAKQETSESLVRIFGSDAVDLVESGDPVQDQAAAKKFRQRVVELTAISKGGDTSATLVIGKEAHPFAIPLMNKDGKWSFDIEAGREELLNRRIGENEIRCIAICQTYAQAQREYAALDRDGDDVLEYAQKIISSEGKQDGLYWPAAAGNESPLGEEFAAAAEEGYNVKSGPQPFHGYLFRILTSQGANAPGGAHSYVVNGNMISGFAAVAYPSEYGSSGVMTFLVGPNGKALQKDLGENTAKFASQMKSFDPDSSWSPAKP